MTIIRIFFSACVVSAFLLIGIRSSADEPNGETKALKSGAIGLLASNRGIRVATPETFAKGGARLVKKNGIVLGILVPPCSTAETCPIEVLFANRGKEKFRCGETGYLLDCIL